MSELKLYFDPISQPSRAVYILLKINKIEFEEVIILISKGEQTTAEFEALNPFKQVPVLVHNGFILTESVAILQYICRTFPIDEHWYPKGDRKKLAKIDEYMSWQHLTIRPIASLNFCTTIQPLKFAVQFLALFGGYGTQEEKLRKFRFALDATVTLMENTWLKNSYFIAGDEITIADLLAVEELEQPRNGGYDIKLLHPKIGEYMDRVKEKLEPHYSKINEIAREIIEELKNSPDQSNYLLVQQ